MLKFDRSGKLLKTWGGLGTGPGQFDTSHSVVVDRKGLVYVADRQNRRVQIFDGDGKYIKEWKYAGSAVRPLLRSRRAAVPGQRIRRADSEARRERQGDRRDRSARQGARRVRRGALHGDRAPGGDLGGRHGQAGAAQVREEVGVLQAPASQASAARLSCETP